MPSIVAHPQFWLPEAKRTLLFTQFHSMLPYTFGTPLNEPTDNSSDDGDTNPDVWDSAGDVTSIVLYNMDQYDLRPQG